MFRVLFPMLVASGILLAVIWLVSDAARSIATRRRRGQLGSDPAGQVGAADASGDAHDDGVQRSRRSLLRARESRVYDQVTDLLQQPDLDLLPQRQVADVLTAVEDLRQTSEEDEAAGPGSGPAAGPAYESALTHAELVVAAASRDLRAARLTGGSSDGDAGDEGSGTGGAGRG